MIKYRSLQQVAIMMVITLGLYSIFLFYWLSREMLAHNERKGYPGLWILAFGLVTTIPFIHVIPAWKFAELVHLTSKGRYNRLFMIAGILTIVLIPIILILTQRLLNEIALEQHEQAAAGGFDELQSPDEFSGDGHADSEPPVGPGPDEPPDSPDLSPDETPEQDLYVESEDIRTIGR